MAKIKLKIAFYKGRGGWKNRLIRWWTKSIYSHAELVMPDEEIWVSISPLLSSTVSFRIKKNPSNKSWDFVEFFATKEEVNCILEFYNETRGSKYDWIGMLLSQFLPFHIKRKNKWYCSEWIAYALRISGIISWKTMRLYNRSDLSPGRLYDIVISEKNNENKT